MLLKMLLGSAMLFAPNLAFQGKSSKFKSSVATLEMKFFRSGLTSRERRQMRFQETFSKGWITLAERKQPRNCQNRLMSTTLSIFDSIGKALKWVGVYLTMNQYT